ncbi:MAG: hypothetical protein K2K64_09995, partial [Muribaculaceae bacterium]|nr:hypothetical protein [Muribaculaceae bacterium]
STDCGRIESNCRPTGSHACCRSLSSAIGVGAEPWIFLAQRVPGCERAESGVVAPDSAHRHCSLDNPSHTGNISHRKDNRPETVHISSISWWKVEGVDNVL